MIKRFSNCSTIGKLMLLIGLFIITPILVLPWYTEDVKYIWAFVIPGMASVILGTIICLFVKNEGEKTFDFRINMGRSSLTVLFAWGWGVIMGALPFIISGELKIIPALFEAVSGWTTTGLSVMDVSKTAKIFLFHRSFMQYCGGLGFIMMMIAFISNKHSMDLYSAEGHPDRILPNIKRTARAIFIIYNICLVLGTIAYRIAGMTWFDGICHTMCSLSTGGFSTKLRSVGEYDSLAIEIITIIEMLIGTTNFAALILLAKGKIKKFFNVSEVKFMFILLFVFIPPTAFSLAKGLNVSVGEGFRKSTFDIVSALSTTGYSTMSYENWPAFAVGVLILMMLIGGGIGSTAGGIKISRVYIMIRTVFLNIKKKFFPSSKVEKPYFIKAQGKVPLDDEAVSDSLLYIVTYLVIYIVGSLLITVTAGCSLTAAMFDFASALGTVGLSIGITNPLTDNWTLIIEMVGMLMGRLEIFIIFIGFTSGFGMIKKLFKKRKNIESIN